MAPRKQAPTAAAPSDHARYEVKYRAFYRAGARFASEPRLGRDVHYRRFLEQQWRPGKLIDFGCGEGHHAATAAEMGYEVLGLDSAPSAIARARETYPQAEFAVADVCDLTAFPDACCDLAVDLGCLQMLRKDREAAAYLVHAFRLLKPGGLAHYQERVPAEDAAAWFPRLRDLTTWWRERTEAKSGRRPRREAKTVEIDGQPVEVQFPLIPAALRGVQQQVRLLTGAGFEVLQVRVVTPGVNAPFEAVMVAQKPDEAA